MCFLPFMWKQGDKETQIFCLYVYNAYVYVPVYMCIYIFVRALVCTCIRPHVSTYVHASLSIQACQIALSPAATAIFYAVNAFNP